MNRGRTALQSAVLETTWGRIAIRAGRRGVAACDLPRPSRCAALAPCRVQAVRLPRDSSVALRQAVKFVVAVLAGRAPGPGLVLDKAVFVSAPPFHRAVWRALRRIPRGRMVSYAELARRAGHPRAARAASGACGANPLPLFVPCHRVVAAQGGLGGFSSGLAWKAHLLGLEGTRR